MSEYQQTLDWLYVQLPMYQRVGASAYKKDLTNTWLLTEYLQNPHQNLKCIHVAGTNGKGSVSHMLASVLQEAGYTVGLYTSPHLIDFRERIKINGEEISKSYIVDFFKQHRPFFEAHHLSFFEMTVGLALDYFNQKSVDIAIIEVGMGGRLDSTNIVHPLISVITTIGLDHTQFLGNTLAEIAFEKAGITKPKVPVVVGSYHAETKPVFEAKAKATKSDIYWASDVQVPDYDCALIGDYQKENKKTVVQTIRVLQEQGFFAVKENHLQQGLLQVIKNTGLMGRWQILQEKPLVICDTAHNKQGLEIVLNQIQKQTFKQLYFVFGVVNDKDLTEILPLFPKNAIYYIAKPNIPRGLDAQELDADMQAFGLQTIVFQSVEEAYQAVLKQATENDFIYVGGSTFVVAEILSFLSCKE